METTALYTQLGRLIETMPNLRQKISNDIYMPLGPAEMMWLGRAEALVAEAMGMSGEIEFKAANQQVSAYREWWANEIPKILYRALAVVEMDLPAPSAGAFIPAGNSFDALKAIQQIFNAAKGDILIVDPYLDENILTEFGLLAPESVPMRLLADAAGIKAALRPALKRFIEQFGTVRPVQLRTAPERTLHDRLIAVDGARVWTVGQSFRDLAKRAPTSFVAVDNNTAALKVSAYQSIWDSATALQ